LAFAAPNEVASLWHFGTLHPINHRAVLITHLDRLKSRGAFDSAKNHKRQRHKRQPVTAKREKSQTPKVLTAILT